MAADLYVVLQESDLGLVEVEALDDLGKAHAAARACNEQAQQAGAPVTYQAYRLVPMGYPDDDAGPGTWGTG